MVLIYVANGLRGGQVQAVHSDLISGRSLDLRDGDFFFDQRRSLEVLPRSQYGLTIDDFGRRIGCSNQNLDACCFGSNCIQRDPLLTPKVSGRCCRLVPIQGFIHEVTLGLPAAHGGQFSGACGVLAGWMSNRTENLFVCGPTAYLVQRQTLVGKEADGSREEPRSRVLTS